MKIKRFIAAATAVFMLTACVGVYADEPTVTVFVDGEQIMFDVDPIIENGRTLVPLRYIFEALDAQVEWIDETQTAVATKGDIKIEVTIDSNKMLKNGEVVELDVPAKLVNDRTLVPARAVSEGLGAKVDWDDKLFKVIITSLKADVNDLYTAVTTPDADGNYTYSQLSPSDLELLKSMYGELRNVYEQDLLPQFLFENPETADILINSKNAEYMAAYATTWTEAIAAVAMQLQIDSEYTYYLENEDMTTEQLVAGYDKIAKVIGISVDDLFEVSCETTPNGTNILLTTFKNVIEDNPMLITSKYLAAASTDGGIRYFTCEYSPVAKDYGMEEDVYFLCEINSEGERKNYGRVSCTAEDFLKGIDAALQGE